MNIWYRNQRGLTLIELLVVMGIIAVLFGMATISLVRTQHNASVSSAADQLVSDLRVQQTRAMSGTTDADGNSNSYGIYFPPSATGTYILFRGTAYSSSDSHSNLIVAPAGVTFTNSITFSNNLPSNAIVFNQRTGEFNGYTTGPYTIKIANSYGTESRTITIDRYGVVTSVTTP